VAFCGCRRDGESGCAARPGRPESGTGERCHALQWQTPLFVLALASLLLKDVERLTGRIVLGTVLIVLGVFLLTAVETGDVYGG
jgi:hypothetical protein